MDQSLSSVGRYVKEWRGGHKYNKVGTIGKGAFAVVFKVTAKFDGVPFAAKELEKRRCMKNGVLDQKVDMEMKIMQKIHHVSSKCSFDLRNNS
jgi:serine/threonine protein kinase